MVHKYKILTYENFLKTFKAGRILKKENVSLSSLHLSGYWIEFTKFVEFIEKHFLEKLHVRGRFRFPRSRSRIWPDHGFRGRELSPRELLFTIRTDFDLILSKIIKK